MGPEVKKREKKDISNLTKKLLKKSSARSSMYLGTPYYPYLGLP